jgi:zinc transport system permease protein
MVDILQYSFMQNAVLAALLASLACGVVGALVVVNRLVFLAGGIAHTAYGGVGIAFFFGLPVVPCSLGVALVASWLVAGLSYRDSENLDNLVGLVWAGGMALGIILVDLSAGYNTDLMSYLFGSLLTVTRLGIWITASLVLVILALVLGLYKQFWIMSYDPDFARARGVSVARLYVLLLSLVALTVVILIQVVGLILVIALLSIPSFIAKYQTGSMIRMMALSAGWAALFCLAGLWLAYAGNISSGAAIVAVAVVVSLGYFAFRGLRARTGTAPARS